MIEVHAEFPQREVIQANAVVDNEEKTVSEVIISAKPEITGVTASVDNETGTPYVDITETGTGTEFSFDLAFHNLKGDKGEQGEQGEPGQDGQAATVTVGTTTTGAAGTNASVVNSGTSSAAVFDFVIPRGDKGDKGDKGDTGSQGPQGVQGEQGPQGIQGPQGETGATGQDGFSPSANVSQSGGVTTISITDKNGTTTESIDLSDFGKVKSVNNTQPDANGDVTLTIPTVNDGTLTVYQNNVSKGTFTANQSSGSNIYLDDTTYNAFTGADGTNAGSSGLVPAPSATDNDKYLKGDGTWASVSGGSSTDVQINGTSITSGGVANIITNSAYNASSNKIATMSDIPDSEVFIAEYNVTSYADVLAAYNAGKAIICTRLGYSFNYYYTLSRITNSTGDFWFRGNQGGEEVAFKLSETSFWSEITSETTGSSTNPVYLNGGRITRCTSTVGNSTTPVYMSSGTITSTGLSIASTRFDGQWVLFSNIISLSTATSATTTDVTSTIKSNMGTAGTDSYKYELLIQTYCNYKSATATLIAITSNQTATISGVSSGTTMGRFFGRITVAADKLLKFQRSAAMDTCTIYFCGYRRIGTNS